MDELSVAINAQVGENEGGRRRFVESLLKSYCQIDTSSFNFKIVVNPDSGNWLPEEVENGMEIVTRPWSGITEKFIYKIPDGIKKNRYVKYISSQKSNISSFEVPDSEGFFQEIGADIVHFPYRDWMKTDLPFVYNLGDLQHRHYPEFFNERTLNKREAFEPEGCSSASRIVASSEFVAEDIATEYRVDREKIQVIMRAPPTTFDQSKGSTQRPTDLECQQFIIYPGKKWPHKNHSRLIRAYAMAKENMNNEPPVLVFTGKNEPKSQFKKLKSLTQKLRVDKDVIFLGHIPSSELDYLYSNCEFLVFPSLFEGQGFPIVEALEYGTPIACSTIPPFVEYAEDAARFFDPKDVSEISRVIEEVTTNERVRRLLSRKAEKRSELFNWTYTARAYLGMYRQVAEIRPDEDMNNAISSKGTKPKGE